MSTINVMRLGNAIDDLMPLGNDFDVPSNPNIRNCQRFLCAAGGTFGIYRGGNCDNSLFFGPDPLIIDFTSIITSDRVLIYRRLCGGYTQTQSIE